MGMTLFDQKTDAIVFDTNFWHWRAIVEAMRALNLLKDDRIEQLHEQFIGELTASECRIVASGIFARVLPSLKEGERLLLDGTKTTVPDDGTMHYDPAEQHNNYSTNRAMLEEFAKCCQSCNGFRVS